MPSDMAASIPLSTAEKDEDRDEAQGACCHWSQAQGA
jgi:hypothetical protein